MDIHNLVRNRAKTMTFMVLSAIVIATQSAAATGPDGKKDAGKSSGSELNLFEKHQDEYVTPEKPAIVNVGPASYLTLEGRGAPESATFRKRIGVMYGVAYGIKMKSKFTGKDFTVSPLEGLWWGNKDRHSFVNEPRDTWNWKLLIRMPEYITAQDVAAAAKQVAHPGSGVKPDDIKLETLREGKCVQVLHVGPYATEPDTIAAMRSFAKENGLTETGPHHEVYISDPTTTPAEQLRTILRQPVK